jgi:peptidoglycan/xylan/chitin deacetylase (PgdA/CDA1 family)
MISDLFGTPDTGVALLYHDIVSRDQSSTSGFVTAGSWRYKLDPSSFRQHLSIIERSRFEPTLVTGQSQDVPVLITFDDGGQSAMRAARALEQYGYRGHFFIVVDRVGDGGFLNWKEVRDLDQRGHHVGSHTLTHINLVEATAAQCRQELQESKQKISDQLGNCHSISIPLGAYDQEVFDAIQNAGYEYVFTSEPLRIPWNRTDRRIGRWNIWHDTDADIISDVLEASPTTVLPTAARWYTLKYLKKYMGHARYRRIRDRII